MAKTGHFGICTPWYVSVALGYSRHEEERTLAAFWAPGKHLFLGISFRQYFARKDFGLLKNMATLKYRVLWRDNKTDAWTPCGERWHYALQQLPPGETGGLVETRSDGPTHRAPALVRQHYERQDIMLPGLCRLCGDGARAPAL